MSVRDYMTLTGFGRMKAEKELNAFCDEPENSIRCVLMGKSTVATGEKTGTFRVKDRFFQGESGVVIGIAADGAVISSGRC